MKIAKQENGKYYNVMVGGNKGENNNCMWEFKIL